MQSGSVLHGGINGGITDSYTRVGVVQSSVLLVLPVVVARATLARCAQAGSVFGECG